jgi:hypothetical protein
MTVYVDVVVIDMVDVVPAEATNHPFDMLQVEPGVLVVKVEETAGRFHPPLSYLLPVIYFAVTSNCAGRATALTAGS